MRAERAAAAVDDRSRPKHVRVATSQKATVVVVGNEADLLALGLVGRHQAEPARVGAYLLLVEIAHRKLRRRELALVERPEKIGLILARVAAASQQIASRRFVTRDARVVSGGDAGGIPRAGARQQRAELEIDITRHARHRRSPAAVCVGERPDHRAVELRLHVQHVVRNVQLARHAPRVVHRLGAAT